MKSFPPSGQNFMSVSLMTYVPDNPVIRRIEYVVQGDGQFYGSQAGSQNGSGSKDVLPCCQPYRFIFLTKIENKAQISQYGKDISTGIYRMLVFLFCRKVLIIVKKKRKKTEVFLLSVDSCSRVSQREKTY